MTEKDFIAALDQRGFRWVRGNRPPMSADMAADEAFEELYSLDEYEREHTDEHTLCRPPKASDLSFGVGSVIDRINDAVYECEILNHDDGGPYLDVSTEALTDFTAAFDKFITDSLDLSYAAWPEVPNVVLRVTARKTPMGEDIEVEAYVVLDGKVMPRTTETLGELTRLIEREAP